MVFFKGAGKTHTIVGQLPDTKGSLDVSGIGLIPRICQGLLTTAESIDNGNKATSSSSTTTITFRCSVSYVEIFLEKVKDLLVPPSNHESPTLKVREHPTDGPFVEGATVAAVTCEQGEFIQQIVHFKLITSL